MKNRIYMKTLLPVVMGLVITGCSHTSRNETPEKNPGDKERTEIRLGGTGTALTRAVGDFPNDGNIGVVATTDLGPVLADTDWTLYDDIFNARANATEENEGVFSFEWETPKYWPMEGDDLYFMAYSPAPSTATSTTYTLNTGRNGLFIVLNEDTPDVMYASANTAPQPYSKANPKVDLGEFRHALSQLTVQVIAGDQMSPNIEVRHLGVTSPARTATLFLPSGDGGLEVTQSPLEPYESVFVDRPTPFPANGLIEGTTYLFPGTQDVTVITLGLVDVSNNDSYSVNYPISVFTSDIPNSDITFERAKRTILRIRVNQTVVENPNENVVLEGTITDWDYQGNYGIGIN